MSERIRGALRNALYANARILYFTTTANWYSSYTRANLTNTIPVPYLVYLRKVSSTSHAHAFNEFFCRTTRRARIIGLRDKAS